MLLACIALEILDIRSMIFHLLLEVGSRGSIMGHVLNPKCAVFFSLSYILNKTKQPKISQFGPIKKFAPLKTEAKMARPKYRIFEVFPNILGYNYPISTRKGYIWM